MRRAQGVREGEIGAINKSSRKFTKIRSREMVQSLEMTSRKGSRWETHRRTHVRVDLG